ncbi:DUF4339 domain-containing protein [Thauera sinica]|uniref:DUF4339 domain-containing protein n=1 Tax=Thauera sinica TaxID=2665146 RepID=A0ABW1ASL4_9RHOO|nr:DUF4339 domain-containing protein [Thauera sp. K11]ATE58987.1 hypothetical protein CCZ27_02555 [Thauera sp. K11]
MTEAAKDWYYALKGEQVGPVDLEQIKSLIAAGTITSQTHVWNGIGDWQVAHAVDVLASLFVHDKPNSPPPLHGTDIDNRYVWAVVAVPIVGTIVEILAGIELWWLFLAANIVCCVLDEKKLKAAGHQAPNSWTTFIVPVYLWKRAELLKHKKHYFWSWVAAFVVSILMSVGNNQGIIEESACSSVTELLAENLPFRAATCKAVTITDEVSSGFYKATATLDNGKDLRITIEEKGQNQIYVTIVGW